MKLSGPELIKRFGRAKSGRQGWEDLWQDIYDYTMPAREGFYEVATGEERTEEIFDETALVSLSQFVSRMASGTMPAHQMWFRFEPGPDVPEADKKGLQTALDEVGRFVWEAIANSNFYNEAQENLNDLAVGWSTLLVDDGIDGKLLNFKCIPQSHTFWDLSPMKQVDGVFRVREKVRIADIQKIWPQAELSDQLTGKLKGDPDCVTNLVEASYRNWDEKGTPLYYYQVVAGEDKSLVVDEEDRGLGARPYVTPRWFVSAGEVYGRGPLVQALPAIRTANLVTEMVLENGQMAISGIWQIDDDGTINVDNVEIVPGAVYARAPDSRGLEQTRIDGTQFNVSDIILANQQENIRKALFAENLGPLDQTPRSATEINARMQTLGEEVAGPSARLKAEWFDPMLQRIIWLLERQGKIEMPRLDGRQVRVSMKSPISRAQRFEEIERIRGFAGDVIGILGPQMAQLYLSQSEVVEQLREKWEIDASAVRDVDENQLMQTAGAMAEQSGGLPAQAEIGQ